MPKKRYSSILIAKGPAMREVIFNSENWKKTKNFKERWGNSRWRIRSMLFKMTDAHMISLVRIAENTGVSLGELLGLGTWNYDPDGMAGRVTKIRTKRGLNKTELAKLCGYSRFHMSIIENTRFKCGPCFATIEIIANTLGVSIREILSKD